MMSYICMTNTEDMVSSDIRFSIVIDTDTGVLTFADVTNYPYWDATRNASGLLQILDSNSNVVYENAGYNTNDYTLPDYIQGLKTGVDTSISNGDTYTINYKVATYLQINYLGISLVATAVDSKFVITGASSLSEAQSIIKYGYISISSGLNVGTFIISSYTISPTFEIEAIVEETLVDDTTTLDIAIFESELTYLQTKSFAYNYNAVTVDISHYIDYNIASLTSTDETSYDATNGIDTLSTYTLTRVHNITAPVGSSYPAIADTSDAQRLLYDIWTNTWTTTITSTLAYDVETWSATAAQIEYVWYQLLDVVSNSKDAIVAAAGLCNLQHCIRVLYDEWLNASITNRLTYELLEDKVIRINNLYLQYSEGIKCGNDVSEVFEEMTQILSESTGCSAPPQGDSVQLVPEDRDIDFVNDGIFDPLTGDLTLTGIGRAGAVINLDGRYFRLQTDVNHNSITNTHNLTTDINHQTITGAGTNSHTQIDSHIGDTTIHFTKDSISHTEILDIGANTHPQIDSHIGDTTIHFTKDSISHTDILDIGTNTHPQIDSHIGDTTIHFTYATINHDTIVNGGGTNSHTQIDSHIGDSTIHFTKDSISHTEILDIGVNTHAQIDSHIADTTIHFTKASISHTEILDIGTNTHPQIDSHIADASIHFTLPENIVYWDVRQDTITIEHNNIGYNLGKQNLMLVSSTDIAGTPTEINRNLIIGNGIFEYTTTVVKNTSIIGNESVRRVSNIANSSIFGDNNIDSIAADANVNIFNININGANNLKLLKNTSQSSNLNIIGSGNLSNISTFKNICIIGNGNINNSTGIDVSNALIVGDSNIANPATTTTVNINGFNIFGNNNFDGGFSSGAYGDGSNITIFGDDNFAYLSNPPDITNYFGVGNNQFATTCLIGSDVICLGNDIESDLSDILDAIVIGHGGTAYPEKISIGGTAHSEIFMTNKTIIDDNTEFILPTFTSAEISAISVNTHGSILYDSDDGNLKTYIDSAWHNVGYWAYSSGNLSYIDGLVGIGKTPSTEALEVGGNTIIDGQAHGGTYTIPFSATATMNANNGNKQKMVVTADTTITLTNFKNGNFTLRLIISGTGAPTITLDSSFGSAMDGSATLINADGDVNLISIDTDTVSGNLYMVSTKTA